MMLGADNTLTETYLNHLLCDAITAMHVDFDHSFVLQSYTTPSFEVRNYTVVCLWYSLLEVWFGKAWYGTVRYLTVHLSRETSDFRFLVNDVLTKIELERNSSRTSNEGLDIILRAILLEEALAHQQIARVTCHINKNDDE